MAARIDPVDGFVESTEDVEMQSRDTERQRLLPSGELALRPSRRCDIANNRLWTLFDEQSRERRIFRQHMQRVANSASHRVARQRKDPCWTRQTHPHRNVDTLNANVPQPRDDRLSFKAELCND